MPRWTVFMAALSLCTLPSLDGQVWAQGALPTTPNATPNAAPTISLPSARAVKPASYVTLNFLVAGRGAYTVVAQALGDPDWIPVTPTRKVTLAGNTLVPVTFRVPPLARVGQSPALEVRVLDGETVVARASTQVQVLPLARITLSSPVELTGREGQRVTFPVEVSNQGNQPDTVTLRVTNLDERPKLSEERLTLQPGERRSVTVSLLIERASSNYRFTTFVEAKSANDAALVARTRTETVFNPVAALDTVESSAPQLTFGVRSALEAGVNWSPTGRSSYVQYSLQPRLGGQLSDYMGGEATAGGLDGSDRRWLPGGVSVAANVSAKTWGFGVSVSRSGLSVHGNLRRGGWKFSPRASYFSVAGARTSAASLAISGPLLGGDLNVEAATRLQQSGAEAAAPDRERTDQVGVSYIRTLSPRLGLLLAGAAAGQTTATGYKGSLLGYQQLSYSAENYDLTQSYSGSAAGVHTFGVTGGLRSIRPFGLRGAVVAQFQPGGVTYSLSGLGLYSAPRGFGFSVSGRYQMGTLPLSRAAWQATAGISTPAITLGRASLSGNGSYTLLSDNDVLGALQHLATVNANLQVGALRSDVSATWKRDPIPGDTLEHTLNVGLNAAYVLRWGDTLSARYDYLRVQGSLPNSPASTSQSLNAGWERQWSPKFSSQLGLGRSWKDQAGVGSVTDALSVGGSLHDLLLPGLTLTGAYRLNAPQGLGQGDYRQGVKVGLTYDLTRSFDTPPAIVKTFGGRIGGEVSGTLYRDDNLNGLRDPQEQALAGVSISAGGVSVKSDAQGHYALRAPVGTYRLDFPQGLPATLEALHSPQVQITENSELKQDVAFAPVSNVEVLVFNDRDRNGLRDDTEEVLPYVAVALSGPMTLSAQADSRGYARFAAVPGGYYLASLSAAGLPEGFQATAPATALEVQPGVRGALIALGAAPPARKAVTTFTTGTLAVAGSLTPNRTTPGLTVRLTLRLQNVTAVQVAALGQTFTPTIKANLAEVLLSVPANTAPGEYNITISASGDTGQKTSVLKLIVTPAQDTPASAIPASPVPAPANPAPVNPAPSAPATPAPAPGANPGGSGGGSEGGPP